MNQKEAFRLEIIRKVINREISQKKGAEILEISARHLRRLHRKFEMFGAEGIVSQKRGKSSNRAISREMRSRIIHTIVEKYPDFGPTLAHEKLQKEGYEVSRSTVRNIMINSHIWAPKKLKPHKLRYLRPRKEQFGEMIQMDGSLHSWFEERGEKANLTVFIDDATGKVTSIYFSPSETREAYCRAFEKHIEKYGLPRSIYTDRRGVFTVNQGKNRKKTHFHISMQELGIKSILAYSPQAKGRVERVNRTLQDRLIKELRLKNISTIDEANAFAEEFLDEYNKKFSVEPYSPIDAHRKLPENTDLDQVFSEKHTRRISKNLTFSFKGILYQVITASPRTLQRKEVWVHETLEGKVSAYLNSDQLIIIPEDEVIDQQRIHGRKKTNLEFEKWKKKKHLKPSVNHPWKTGTYF